MTHDPGNVQTLPLSEQDYDSLAARWISQVDAIGALLSRVTSIDGAAMMGVQIGRGGNYAGILIPYVWPGDPQVRMHRLRRDHPDMEQTADGLKPRRKYLSPPGSRNMFYLPPQVDPEYIANADMPVVMVEGEFKTLALWRLAWYGLGDSADSPAFLPVGLQGVSSWRGKVGRTTDSNGVPVEVRGPVSDFDKITWQGRRVIIVYDSNVERNLTISSARWNLTEELHERGAEVAWFKWPKDVPPEINGVDDLLAARGPDPVIKLMSQSRLIRRRDKKPVTAADAVEEPWRERLLCNDRGPKPILANALLALREAPEWEGRLAFDEFRVRAMAPQGTIWRQEPYAWGDDDDARLAEWLQHRRVDVSPATVAQAVEVIAREHAFHPVREYLRGLKWDGKPRIDQWLPKYFGCADTPYTRAIGSRWLISAVARVMRPGCQADYCLILQGIQGLMKSSALRAMGGEWFTDDIEELGSKDSAIQIHGVWIVELGELDALVSQRAELSKVKAFVTRRVDHFRPPYGRRTADFPRQCVFAGSVNDEQFLRDDTGGRRWWSVSCTTVDRSGIERDRDQLWAEALNRFDAGGVWWLPEAELVAAAAEEQDMRLERDPWETLVLTWVSADEATWREQGKPIAGYAVSAERVLDECVKKKADSWTRFDRKRVGTILRNRGMEYWRKRIFDDEEKPVLGPDGKQVREWVYRWPDTKVAPKTT